MHVLIAGGGGQLGRAVQAAIASRTDWDATVWTHAEHDVAHPETAGAVQALAPDLVINCAAWTNVDGAEQEPGGAFAVNALGPQYLAQGCAAAGSALVHISTNEVFGGEPGSFYYEYDQPQPRSVYARSKRAGEVAAAQQLQRLYIVRTSWLFGPGGNNFPAKIIAAADRHGALNVVDDEIGVPTYAPDVADAVISLVSSGRYGVYHLVNQGHTSRFGWTQAALAGTGRDDIPLTPIKLVDWPRPAMPPYHAVLVNQAAAALGIVLRPWEAALAEYLAVEGERFARAPA